MDSYKILRQAEFKRKLNPSSRALVTPCTWIKHELTRAQEKSQTESRRSKKGWSDKWFEGMVSVRRGELIQLQNQCMLFHTVSLGGEGTNQTCQSSKMNDLVPRGGER